MTTKQQIDSLVLGIKSNLADYALFSDLSERSKTLPNDKQAELLSVAQHMTNKDEIAMVAKKFLGDCLQ